MARYAPGLATSATCVPVTSTSVAGSSFTQTRQSTMPSVFVYTASCGTEAGMAVARPVTASQRQKPV